MRPSSAFLVLLSITASLADGLLPRDGVVTDKDFIGYTNINYHATRYEPLCGSFGSITPDKFFQKPVSEGGQCDQAISQYVKIPDTLAMYDLTGVKLSGAAAIVGNGGDPKCMCFSLALLSGGSGDICVWVNGDAQTQTVFDGLASIGSGYYVVQSSFKPGSAKALPQCGGDVNVTSLETKWSATAFFDTATTSPTSAITTTSTSGTTTSTGTSTGSSGSSGGTAPPTGGSSTGSQTQSADAVNQTQSPPNGALASAPGGIFSTTALVLVALALTVVPV